MQHNTSSHFNTIEEKHEARFTGIFIPAEILQLEDLSPLDIMVLSWIDALMREEKGGCYASNDYLAAKLKVKKDTVSKVITKLKKMDLIRQVSFDGRQRILVSYRWFHKHQSYADSDCSPIAIGPKSYADQDKNPSPSIYSKDKSKDKHIEASPVSVLSFGLFVKLKQSEYDTLCSQHGKPLIDRMIISINDFMESTGKKYVGFAATIRNWIQRDSLKKPKSNDLIPPTQPNELADRIAKGRFLITHEVFKKIKSRSEREKNPDHAKGYKYYHETSGELVET